MRWLAASSLLSGIDTTRFPEDRPAKVEYKQAGAERRRRLSAAPPRHVGLTAEPISDEEFAHLIDSGDLDSILSRVALDSATMALPALPALPAFPALQAAALLLALALGLRWALVALVPRIRVKSVLRNLPGPPSASWLSGNLDMIYDPANIAWHHETTRKYGGVVKYHALFGVRFLLFSSQEQCTLTGPLRCAPFLSG